MVRRSLKEKPPITYQNKDVISKLMADEFKGKTFAVYGIDVPEIVDVRPTNLPAVEANELRLDNLFLLSDGSYAIVDYESEYDEGNKCDYINYLARVISRLYNELGYFVQIRLIIIYTADVSPDSTNPLLDLGSVRLNIQEAFLTEIDTGSIFSDVSDKINRGSSLTDEDMMKLIIYPLTEKGRVNKQNSTGKAIDLARNIKDRKQSVFVLKMLLAFTDKFISDDDANRIKEEITMTKVERLFAEEREAAVKAAVDRTTVDVTKRIAMNFLMSGESVENVSKCTDLTEDVVENLLKSLQK